MKHHDELDNILLLLHNRQLGKAIDALSNYLAVHPRQKDADELEAVREDYARMRGYWLQGYSDPHLTDVYCGLLQRAYVLTVNVIIAWQIGDSPFLKAMYLRPRNRRKDWSLSAVRAEMEAFTGNVTMLQLEPEHTRQQKSEALHQEHWEQMRDLFDYILTSREWREGLADDFIEMLVSPTLYTHDQQLVVSAIFLSAYHHFCPQKFRVLAEVFQQTTDEPLRQYAFVGWALLLRKVDAVVFPGLLRMTNRMLSDERTRSELAELQMQLVYCREADVDSKTIQNEIMPDIYKTSRRHLNELNLSLTDEDRMEDILHPEASEQDMEHLEQSINRMMNMQKQGADIYFSGFSQMKRYPFFTEVVNWFVPFYPQHPAVSKIWNNVRGKKFLKAITRMGAFCDSDKYSFVLSFEQVLRQLPNQLLQLIDEGEATATLIGGEVAVEDQQKPAFIRRLYLQNIYRFCRLYAARNEFDNIFDEERTDNDLLFFAAPCLHNEAMQSHFIAVAGFMMKRHRYKDVVSMLGNMPGLKENDQACLMMGTALMRTGAVDGLSPAEYFRQVLGRNATNGRALSGMARLLFSCQQYDEALHNYELLMTLNPGQRNYQLNAAICFIHLGRVEEALKLLFRLSYDDAADLEVLRVLAWAQTIDGRYEQARENFERLLQEEEPQAGDLLNYGYNEWLSGRNEHAVGLFKRFVKEQEGQNVDLDKEFMDKEHELLSEHDISDVEIQLMINAVENM